METVKAGGVGEVAPRLWKDKKGEWSREIRSHLPLLGVVILLHPGTELPSFRGTARGFQGQGPDEDFMG